LFSLTDAVGGKIFDTQVLLNLLSATHPAIRLNAYTHILKNRGVHWHPGDEKCATEILGGGKKKEVGGANLVDVYV